MQVIVSSAFSGGQYTIDTQDFWIAYGWMIESGGDDFLQLYKSKEVYSKDWKGQNGKQYDLSKRFFDDKVVTLSGYLIAEDEDDFWIKYLALWDLFKAPGARSIYSFELKQTFSAFYLDSPNAKRLTRLVDHPGKIAMKLDIQFQVMFMEFEPPISVPRPPKVNAGPDRTIRIADAEIVLSGASITANSGASITSINWAYVSSSPSGLSLAIQNQTSLTPRLYNPNSGPLAIGVYTISLTAVDSNGRQSTDEMKLTVLADGAVSTGFPYPLPITL